MLVLEQQSLAYTHADVGARLLENWKVPASIWEPVSAHHDPENGGEYIIAASAIHIADAWVNTYRSGSGEFAAAIKTTALERMGIEIDEMDSIGSSAGEQTNALLRQFMAH